jgi:hypothetical protein
VASAAAEWQRVELDRLAVVDDASDEDLLAIDEALERLAQESPPCAQLVKLRFFAGLTLDEAATALGLARRTAAGTTPFPKERFKRAAYDEIRRIIREEEPPRPSTRLLESKDSLPLICKRPADHVIDASVTFEGSPDPLEVYPCPTSSPLPHHPDPPRARAPLPARSGSNASPASPTPA